MTAKAIHDLLLEHKPDDAKHDRSTCTFCKVEQASNEGGRENVADDKIYDQHTLDTLIASAVEKAVNEAQESAEKDIVGLSSDLANTKTLLVQAEEEIESLRNEIASRDEAIRLASIADEREAKVGAIVTMTEERVAASRDRWARMSEEEFSTYLEELEVIKESATAVKDDDSKTMPNQVRRESAAKKDEKSPALAFIKRTSARL